MKSKYNKTGLTNDLESVGYMVTPCETVLEFVTDVVTDSSRYTFTFHKAEMVSVRAVLVKVASLTVNGMRIVENEGYDAVQGERIHLVKYRDGWGGVEFRVILKGWKE